MVANFGKCRTAVFLASALAILATVSVCVGGGFGADLARMSVTTVGGGVPVATGDSCTGSLEVSAHFENSDDITVGSGCSSGDTTWAKTNATYSNTQANDGTYSLSLPNLNQSQGASLSVSSSDIASDAEGRVELSIYLNAAPNDANVFIIRGGTSNEKIFVNFPSTSSLNLRHRNDGGAVDVTVTGLTVSTETWHTIIARWKRGGNPTLSISFDGTANTSTTALTSAWSGGPTVVEVGDLTDWAIKNAYIDTFKVYNTYAD